MTKEADKNAHDMGGPSFHPEILKEKAPKDGAGTDKKDGAILREDQVPPL